MSELLPSAQAREIRDGLLDYLTTTFALADPDAQLALAEFLSDREHGIFKGPYLRLRLPVPRRGRRVAVDPRLGHRPHALRSPGGGVRPAEQRGSRAGQAAAAAHAGHDGYRVRQDRGVPVPDPRPRAAGPPGRGDAG